MNNQINWKPFVRFATMFAAILIAGFGLMFLWSSGNSGGSWGAGRWFPGAWGMGFFWIFPVFGLAMMLVMMFFFFNLVSTRRSPMDWFLSDRPQTAHPTTAQHEIDSQCPTCDSIVQPDWKVCPCCGASLK